MHCDAHDLKGDFSGEEDLSKNEDFANTILRISELNQAAFDYRKNFC